MAGTQEEFERILESSLDRLQSGEATLETILVEYPDLADELRPLLEMVDWLLAKKATLAPRPKFISSSRQNLVARLQSEQIVAVDLAAKLPRPGFYERMRQWLVSASQSMNRRVVLQFATVVVLLIGMFTGGVGIAYASQGTLPGEVLYPVKISLEQVELFLSLDEANDIYLHMEFAQRRTDEMQALVALNRYLYLRDTLANYQYHVSESMRLVRVVAANDLAKAKAIAPDVHRMVMEQPTILKRLASTIPEQIFSGMVTALEVSEGWVQAMESLVKELEIELTPTPGMENTSVPSSTSIDTQTLEPTGTIALGSVSTSMITNTPTATQTQTPTSTPSLFPWLVKTNTNTPRPGSTHVPPGLTLTFTATLFTPSSTPNSTPVPSATQPIYTATRTLPPTATRTLPSTPTSTSPPVATSTIPPPPTATAPPPPTATQPPPPTATTPPYP